MVVDGDLVDVRAIIACMGREIAARVCELLTDIVRSARELEEIIPDEGERQRLGVTFLAAAADDALAAVREPESLLGDATRCSFCAKAQGEIGKLVAGPGVFICHQCVKLCWDIMQEEQRAGAERSGPIALGEIDADQSPPSSVRRTDAPPKRGD